MRGPLHVMVNRRMPQYKKHKTWDGDAVLVLNGAKGTLYDLEGKLYVSSFSYNTRLNTPVQHWHRLSERPWSRRRWRVCIWRKGGWG